MSAFRAAQHESLLPSADGILRRKRPAVSTPVSSAVSRSAHNRRDGSAPLDSRDRPASGVDLREVRCNLGEDSPLPRLRVASDTNLHRASPRSSIAGTDQSHHFRRLSKGRQPGFGNDDEGVTASSSSASAQQARGSFGERATRRHRIGPMDFIAVDEPEMNREVAAALARIVRALRVQLRKEAA